MTLERLKRDFENLLPKIEKAANDKAKEFAVTFVEIVTNQSRVDTSKLISNFQVFVGSASDIVIEAHVPGKLGSTRSLSRSVAISNAKTAVAGKLPGQVIEIVNNAPYLIESIDIGPSFQIAESTVGTDIKLGR